MSESEKMSDRTPLVDYLTRDIAAKRDLLRHATAPRKIPKLEDILTSSRSPLDECHARYDRVVAYIEMYHISDVQRMIVKRTLNCMAKTFYGDLLDTYRPAILMRNGWTNEGCAPVLRFLSGRRIGKSFIMTIIIAALLVNMKGCNFVVFAPSQRQSGWIGLAVQKNLAKNAPHLWSKIKTQVDGSITINHGPGLVTKLLCPPCNENVRSLVSRSLSGTSPLQPTPPPHLLQSHLNSATLHQMCGAMHAITSASPPGLALLVVYPTTRLVTSLVLASHPTKNSQAPLR